MPYSHSLMSSALWNTPSISSTPSDFYKKGIVLHLLFFTSTFAPPFVLHFLSIKFHSLHKLFPYEVFICFFSSLIILFTLLLHSYSCFILSLTTPWKFLCRNFVSTSSLSFTAFFISHPTTLSHLSLLLLLSCHTQPLPPSSHSPALHIILIHVSSLSHYLLSIFLIMQHSFLFVNSSQLPHIFSVFTPLELYTSPAQILNVVITIWWSRYNIPFAAIASKTYFLILSSSNNHILPYSILITKYTNRLVAIEETS